MITRRIPPVLAILTVLASFAACRKKELNPTGSTSTQPPVITVLGTQNDSVITWKDGAATTLFAQNKDLYQFGSASLATAGNNIYVAGFQPENNSPAYPWAPVYWLNGALTGLSDTTSVAPNGVANAIGVSGTDLYVAGVRDYFSDTGSVPFTSDSAVYPVMGSLATLWKNGVPLTLPASGVVGLVDSGKYAKRVRQDYVSGIFISGADSYVSGGTTWVLPDHASYWKNGAEVPLAAQLIYNGPNNSVASPTTTGIYVSGKDVYVSGVQNTVGGIPVAMYWKNGNPVFLSDSSGVAVANAIFVDGSDVYITGWANIGAYSRAVLWKNGAPTYLSDGTTASSGYALTVSHGSVYVAGAIWLANGNCVATYWKDGVPVYLSNPAITSAIAFGISVQ